MSLDGSRYLGISKRDRQSVVVKFKGDTNKDFVITRMHSHKDKTLTAEIVQRSEWEHDESDIGTFSDHNTDNEAEYEPEDMWNSAAWKLKEWGNDEEDDESAQNERLACLEPVLRDGTGEEVPILKAYQINRYRCPPPFVGFVDGLLMLGGCNEVFDEVVPFYLSTTRSYTNLVFTRALLPTAYGALVISLPLRKSDAYASEGVIVRTSLYQLNRNTMRFEKVRVLQYNDEPFAFVRDDNKSKPFDSPLSFSTAMFRGNLFVAQCGNLYELSWKDNALVSTEHLPGIYHIQTIISAEPYGLIITTSPSFDEEISCVLYCPEPLSSPELSSPYITSGEYTIIPKTCFGIWKDLDVPNNLVWSQPRASLLAFEGGRFAGEEHAAENFVHSLHIDDIFKLPAFQVQAMVNTAQLEKEREFDTYKHNIPLEWFKSVLCSFSRAGKIYKLTSEQIELHSCLAIWEKTPNAAARCYCRDNVKIFDSLSDMLAQYLGAPITYKKNNHNQKEFSVAVSCDFWSFRKSSDRIIVESAKSTLEVTSTLKLSKVDWLGILCYWPTNQMAKASYALNSWESHL